MDSYRHRQKLYEIIRILIVRNYYRAQVCKLVSLAEQPHTTWPHSPQVLWVIAFSSAPVPLHGCK